MWLGCPNCGFQLWCLTYVLVELNPTMKLPVIYIETLNKALNSLEIDGLWNLMGYVHNFPSIHLVVSLFSLSSAHNIIRWNIKTAASFTVILYIGLHFRSSPYFTTYFWYLYCPVLSRLFHLQYIIITSYMDLEIPSEPVYTIAKR